MTIKLEKIRDERKNAKLIFMIKGADEVFANTIRRTIIEEVPTLAVEDIEIKEQGSALYDEMFALRVGLTPIKTDLKSYNLKSECKCESAGCAQCELKITLKANKKSYVYAGESESSDPKCTFVYEKMPLTKLITKQKVDLTMTAILGRGREHTKWSPGWAFYKKERVVNLGKKKKRSHYCKKKKKKKKRKKKKKKKKKSADEGGGFFFSEKLVGGFFSFA